MAREPSAWSAPSQRCMRALLAVAMTLMLLACARSSSPSAPSTGIYGTVTAGPTCPVERADSPCPPRPWSGSVRATDRNGEVLRRGDGSARELLAGAATGDLRGGSGHGGRAPEGRSGHRDGRRWPQATPRSPARHRHPLRSAARADRRAAPWAAEWPRPGVCGPNAAAICRSQIGGSPCQSSATHERFRPAHPAAVTLFTPGRRNRASTVLVDTNRRMVSPSKNQVSCHGAESASQLGQWTDGTVMESRPTRPKDPGCPLTVSRSRR